jgi:hypothetical protein
MGSGFRNPQNPVLLVLVKQGAIEEARQATSLLQDPSRTHNGDHKEACILEPFDRVVPLRGNGLVSWLKTDCAFKAGHRCNNLQTPKGRNVCEVNADKQPRKADIWSPNPIPLTLGLSQATIILRSPGSTQPDKDCLTRTSHFLDALLLKTWDVLQSTVPTFL